MTFRPASVTLLAAVLMMASCRSVDPETQPSGMFGWRQALEQNDDSQISAGSAAQLRITNTLAGAGAGMVIGGAIMLAIPGVRQWGGTTALSGIALAWLAIAFGHPLVPLLGFIFLIALSGWKIYKRIIKSNLQNE